MLTVKAKFPNSGIITTSFIVEDLTENRVKLFLNQPFIQQTIRPNSRGLFFVDSLHFNPVGPNEKEVIVVYEEASEREFSSFNLSFIIAGQYKIQTPKPRIQLKFFTEKPEDLSFIVRSQLFKMYLFLVLSGDLEGMSPLDYFITVEELSAQDHAMILLINHV